MTSPLVIRRRSTKPTAVVVVPPPTGQPAWQFGMVVRNDTGDAAKCASLNVTIARIEFDIGMSQATLDSYFTAFYNAGVRLQPLLSYPDGHLSTAQAQSVSSWSNRYGTNGAFWSGKANPLPIRHIEFGNENSYGYKAGGAGYGDNGVNYRAWAATYAQRAKSAAQALTNGVGLLIQLDNADGWVWVDGIYQGVPDIHNYAAGWTSHPYGPNGNNKPIADAAAAAAKGAPVIPWYFTEWGLSTDNGRTVYQGGSPENYGWNASMTYAQAGTQITATVAALRSYWGTRLKNFMYYLVADDAAPGAIVGSPSQDSREPYFGALQNSGADKVGYSGPIRTLATSV